MSALFEAVRAGDLAGVKKVLKTKPLLDEEGDDGMTPLILAAKNGRADLVKELLAAGADATFRDAMQETAILKAGAEGYVQVVELLAAKSPPDDVEQAKAFLRSVAHNAAPMREDLEAGDKFRRGVAEVAANASAFFGDENPRERLERIDRAEENAKKKR